MSHFIKVMEAEQCVFLTLAGQASQFDAAGGWREAGRLLKAREWNRAVIDTTGLTPMQTALALLDLTHNILAYAPSHAHTAIIVRPEYLQCVRVLEIDGQENGVTIAAFVDPATAMDWTAATERRRP